MTHTIRTLSLSDKWDLELTDTGKIAVKSNAAATAQNVANECRRFRNDSYFNHDIGIPYFVTSLGRASDNAVLRAYVRQAVLRVEDIAEIENIELTEFDKETRILNGTIQIITISGGTLDDVSI